MSIFAERTQFLRGSAMRSRPRESQDSDRQTNRRAKAAERTLLQPHIAAMGARDVARDGKAETDAAGLQIAPLVQPVEGTKRFLAATFGDARSVVLHRQFDISADAPQAHLDAAAIFQCIVDEVDEAALDRVALDRHRQGFA